MSERRLAAVLTRRFTRVAWTGLAGYALLVVALFAAAAEMALRRSLDHSADLTQSLLGAYRDSTSEPGGVMPSALADRLVAMGGQVVITRTTTGAGGKQDVYFVSPDMPAKRLEGLPASASSDDVRRALLAAIAQRARSRSCGLRSSGQRPRADPRWRRATRSARWNGSSTRRQSWWKSCCSSPGARTASWRSRTRPSSSRRWWTKCGRSRKRWRSGEISP